MKRLINFACLTLALSVIAACDKSQVGGGEKASISTDKTVVSVASDNLMIIDPFAEEKPDLTDTVIVSSTRSWSVTVETSDGGEWVYPQTTEHINASEKYEDFPLVLQFDRYTGTNPRTAKVTIHAAELDPVVLNVTQAAYVKSLKVTAGESTILPSGECTSTAIIRSNTPWTAHIDAASSTVNPTLSIVSGETTGIIELKFPINVSDELAKVATLVVESEGCEPQRVEFIQKQTKSYFALEEPVPAVVPAYLEKIHIPLLSNDAWTAKISDCTFENAKLSIEGGTNCLYGFDFIADHGFDPGIEPKKATITISRAGMTNIVVSFSQEGSIHLTAMDFDPEYEWDGNILEEAKQYRPFVKREVFPFSSPTELPTKFDSDTNDGIEVDLVMANGGYTFTAYGKDCGCWLGHTGVGLAIGKTKDDYLLFPAVPGKRLAKMYYQASCVSETPYTVRTADGKIVIKGGELTWTKFIVPVTGDIYDMHEHIFPETEVGVRYRLNLEETLRYISIKDICLVYE